MFQNWIINTFRYYSLCGFHSIPSMRIGGKSIKYLIIMIHSSLCVWYSYIIIKGLSNLQSNLEFLDVINIFAFNFSCILTLWLIIYDSYTNQNAQNAFGATFYGINATNFFCSARKLEFLIPMNVLTVGDCVIFALATFYGHGTHHENVIHCLFLGITDNRAFFYVLHLKIIAIQLEAIETKLKTMQTQSILWRKRLKWVKHHLQLTHEMCININKIFGLSHLAMIFLTFQTMIALMNNELRSSKQKKNKHLSYGIFSIQDNQIAFSQN